MSVTELGPVDHEKRDQMAPGRRTSRTQPPAAFSRYRVLALIPLLTLVGAAVAGLAGIAGIVDASVSGSGCCPPVY